MTLPDDKRRRSPRDRFRNILSAERDDEQAPETRKPAVVNLPKIRSMADESESQRSAAQSGPQPVLASPGGSRMLSAFWTVGSILSVVANVVLLTMLKAGPRGVTGFDSAGAQSRTLVGVYANLQQMDQAHIRATIPIETTVALDTSVPLKTLTSITLARDAFISGAHVNINAAGVSIDAPADVTLPAGTMLDVNLDVVLPLTSALPIAAEAPLDVAVRDTELHAAIQGLQDSLRPLVCATSPAATLADGTALCR